MATFEDAQGREWTIDIDIPTIKKLRNHDLDVLAMFDGEMEVFEQIVGDPVKLVDTLWLVCEEQIADQGLDENGFAKALKGDALMRAAHAMVEGVCDFFPDPKRRQALKEMFRKVKETEAILLENAEQGIAALDVNMIVQAMQTESGEKSGKLADSSASTPA